jgi:hypothetical protein
MMGSVAASRRLLEVTQRRILDSTSLLKGEVPAPMGRHALLLLPTLVLMAFSTRKLSPL